MRIFSTALAMSCFIPAVVSASPMKVNEDGEMVPAIESTAQSFDCNDRSVVIFAENVSAKDRFISINVFYNSNDTQRHINFWPEVEGFLGKNVEGADVSTAYSIGSMKAICFGGEAYVGLEVPALSSDFENQYLILTDEGRVLPGYDLTGHAPQ